MKSLRTILLAATCVAMACASDPIANHPANPEIQRQITAILQTIRTQGGSELLANLHRLVAYDVFAVDQVAELADDQNARLRSNAMYVLAQISDPEQSGRMEKIEKVLRRGLEDDDETVRYEAATGLASRGAWDVLPVLIDGLSSAEPGIRYRCNQQLIATTSQDFGYSVDGDVTHRGRAADQWRAWYERWQQSHG